MRPCLLIATLALGLCAAPLAAREASLPIPPSGVIGVSDAQLAPSFWIAKLAQPDRVILDRREIAALNAEVLQRDPTMHDLRKLPATLDRARVLGWIDGVSTRPTRTLYDVHGQPVPATTLDALMANLARDAVPAQTAPRYGLVVKRAALRAFPTELRVFSSQGDTDIDRFQETAEFPSTPVAVLHASGDGQWLFVLSPRYGAWVRKEAIATGTAAQVFGYVDASPYRVVTGGVVRTVYTPENPAVSQLQLDMGARLPLAELPPDQPVNGEGPYTSWTLKLPVRGADGTLGFSPALLPKTADSAAAELPLTRANLLRQAFKLLGERYGWGHAYDARDCSGFVSDVYRSLGVVMPRNTSAQAVSPALSHTAFDADSSRAARLRAVAALEVGDLVYIPGHVMMVIGRIDGQPWVIHDTTGISYRDARGALRRVTLNAVSVTPLMPLLFNDHESYVDRMTSIVRIRR